MTDVACSARARKTGRRGSVKARVKDSEFAPLQFGEQSFLFSRNYKVKQLKAMCSHYGLRVSGNKDELQKRLSNFLEQSVPASLLQRWAHHMLVKRCAILRGPAYAGRRMPVNETDFYSMTPCTSIPSRQFMSIADQTGTIYAFDILSLVNLFRSQGSKVSNPYSRQPFPAGTLPDLKRLIRLGKALGHEVVTRIPTPPVESLEKRCASIFHDITLLGVGYPCARWFTELGRLDTVRYLRELRDIWDYRVGIDRRIQREICPPDGRPFSHVPPGIERGSLRQAREAAVTSINRMVRDGVNSDSQKLGAMYVLCALTLVSPEAASSLPHFYESAVGPT